MIIGASVFHLLAVTYIILSKVYLISLDSKRMKGGIKVRVAQRTLQIK